MVEGRADGSKEEEEERKKKKGEGSQKSVFSWIYRTKRLCFAAPATISIVLD